MRNELVFKRTCAVLVLACMTQAIAPAVHAQAAPESMVRPARYDHGWAIGINAEYSDNILRATPEDAESDTSAAGTLRFDFGTGGTRWTLTARSDLEYRTYQHESIPNELEGGFDGFGEYSLIKDHLTVYVEDNYGQIRRDSTLPESPENRGGFNVLTVGSDLDVPLTNRLSFFAEGSASQATYEDAAANYERREVAAGLRHALSEYSSLYVRALRSRVSFADETSDVAVAAADEGYDIDEAMLGFSTETLRTLFDFGVGRTIVRGVAESPKQLLFRGSIRRAITSRATVTFEAGTEYSDSTQTFVREQDVIDIGQSGSSSRVEVDPFKSDYAGLAMGFDGSRWGVDGSVLWRRERHDDNTDLNREFWFVELSVTRTITERTHIYIRGAYNRSEEHVVTPGVSGTLYDTEGRIGFTFRPWRTVLVETYGETYSGRSLAQVYRENRVGLAISYSPTALMGN